MTLTAYNAATTERARALAALKMAEELKSPGLAWDWAAIAAEHAQAVGVGDARRIVGLDRRPDVGALRAALEKSE